MMTPTSLQAISALTGEPCHPCKRDGIVYAVSKSWTVWHRKQQWHAVNRSTCKYRRNKLLETVIVEDLGVPWADMDVSLQCDLLERLRRHKERTGYTVVKIAVRMGYSPSNNEVRRILTGNRATTVPFAQRAVAAFGRGVLGGV